MGLRSSGRRTPEGSPRRPATIVGAPAGGHPALRLACATRRAPPRTGGEIARPGVQIHRQFD